MDYLSTDRPSRLIPRPVVAATSLTKGRLKADPHIEELIRLTGGMGSKRRTRKWAAFAFLPMRLFTDALKRALATNAQNEILNPPRRDVQARVASDTSRRVSAAGLMGLAR
jgi:hypothetical protein